MGFLSPWFLAAAAAIGLPFWLHLRKRHKSTPMPFGSLMFFEPRTQSSVKHRRLEHILLFAMRAALLALLALAFASPYIRTASPLAHRNAVAVIALDDSLSMQYGGRFERAKQQASVAIASLPAGQSAQIVAFASGAHVLTQPVQDRAELRAALASITPADGRSSYAELAHMLRAQNTPVELHLFTDLQKSSVPPAPADLLLSPGSRLALHRVADGASPNWTVETLNAPRRIYGATAHAQATIAGFDTPAARRRVSLILNGKASESKEVEVPAAGRATVDFTLELPHGWNRGEVRAEPADALSRDDRYLFAIERAEPKPALFVRAPRDTRSAIYFRAALEASGNAPFRLEETDATRAASSQLSNYALVVLSDTGSLAPQFEEALGKYVRAGGALLIALGPASAPAHNVPVANFAIAGGLRPARDAYDSVSWMDSAHATLRDAGRWDGVRFYHAVRFEPGEALVLARLAGGTPLLAEARAGQGRILVFGSTFDNIANDLPLHTAFVPFVQRTAEYLGGADPATGRAAVVDSYIDVGAGPAEVLDPRGARVSRSGSSARFEEAGFYEVHRAGRPSEVVAVNTDRRESDLTPAPEDTVAWWHAPGAVQQGGATPGQETKLNLWWYVMLAALVCALAESVLANRLLTETKERKALAAKQEAA